MEYHLSHFTDEEKMAHGIYNLPKSTEPAWGRVGFWSWLPLCLLTHLVGPHH